MRIAFFIPIIAGRGGIETVVTNLLNELDRLGDDPRLFLFSGSKEKDWLRHLPWVKEIGSPAQSRPLRLVTYLAGALRELRHWRPDAIVCTHPSTLRLAHFCRRVLGLKEVPIVIWLHGPIHTCEGMASALHRSHGAICICEMRAQEIRQAFSRVTRNPPPVRVAHNGTSIADRCSISRPQVPTFLYIGRLMVGEQKRVADIIHAAAQLRGEFKLVMIGDGSDREELQRLAEGTGVASRVEWLGWQADPWSCISSVTALLLASSFEGFPMACVEALGLGVPVVCSEYPGFEEIVLTGQTGWTFPVGDVNALTDRLQAILDGRVPVPSPQSVQKFGAMFSTESMAQRFRAALDEMRAGLGSRCGRSPVKQRQGT